MCVTKIGEVSLYQSKVLLKFENLVHGFTTRHGGVSKGAYESLSLSPFRGDDIENVHRNEEILCRALSLDVKKLSSTKQEHTDNVEIIEDKRIGIGVSFPWEKGVDACITTQKDVPLLCYSADCVPILLYADDIEAIAAVHAGWKGSRDKIISKTVEKLYSMGAHSENIYAAIGPCIGKCCYEVDYDVASQFDEIFSVMKGDGKYMLDLESVNYSLLKQSKVKEENISRCGICTKCHNDLFFSHRGQNGKSGTLGGIICMRK